MRGADVTASTRLDRHVRPAAVAAAGVDDAFMDDRRRDGEPVRVPRKPQKLAGARVVRVDALARIDDDLRTARAVDDERRAVRGASLSAIGLPAILAGSFVEREKIRRRGLIAQQDQ